MDRVAVIVVYRYVVEQLLDVYKRQVDASMLNDGVVVNLSSDDDTPELVISVPDERMKKLDVTSDYGDVDVSRVTLEEMSITTEDGDIDLRDVDCSSVTLTTESVSYTHLDVYKRQEQESRKALRRFRDSARYSTTIR